MSTFKSYKNNAWEDPEINRKYEADAWTDCEFAKRYISDAWEEVWTAMKPITISKDNYFDGSVTAVDNDISISFGTSESRSSSVYIDISGSFSLPIITGTLTFHGGKDTNTYYYHENIRWTVSAYDAAGAKHDYDLPNSNGQHAFDYSAEVYLPIPLEAVTQIRITMSTGTYNDTDVLVSTGLLGLMIDDIPYGTNASI